MSLDILESTTKDLGQRLRDFESATCSAFQTCELKRETEARQRRQTKVATEPNAASTSEITEDVPPSLGRPGPMTIVNGKTPLQSVHIARKQKKFNLNTYKTHSLGDYVRTIRMYGTTDSYSTEPVSSFYLSENWILKYLIVGA